MNCLVDTNILSELARPNANAGIRAWAATVTRAAVSVITVEELHFGLAWKPHPRVEAWLAAFLEEDCDVLPVTGVIARRAGELRGSLQRRGLPRHQADMLIAATASIHGLTLVTRNTRDFEGCGIALLDPFAGGS